MLRIRFKRVGRKNAPHYQVVVIPRANSAQGDITAKLGWYNPKNKKAQIDKDLAIKWLDNGAQPTNSVAKIFIEQKIDHKLVKYTQATPKAVKSKKTTKKKAPKAPTENAGKDENEEEVPAESENLPEATDEKINLNSKTTK